jgi:hypothetical protein
MILEKSIIRTARWSKENDSWYIKETLNYQWFTLNNISKSPLYTELSDALKWIISHDENLS